MIVPARGHRDYYILVRASAVDKQEQEKEVRKKKKERKTHQNMLLDKKGE